MSSLNAMDIYFDWAFPSGLVGTQRQHCGGWINIVKCYKWPQRHTNDRDWTGPMWFENVGCVEASLNSLEVSFNI